MAEGIYTLSMILPLDQSEDEKMWRLMAARELGVPESVIQGLRLLKHSLDARQKNIKVNLQL